MDPSLDEPQALIPYSLSQYLLDRINIHDTITRVVSNCPALRSNLLMTGVLCNSLRILIAEILSVLEMKSLPHRRLQ